MTVTNWHPYGPDEDKPDPFRNVLLRINYPPVEGWKYKYGISDILWFWDLQAGWQPVYPAGRHIDDSRVVAWSYADDNS